MTRDGTASTSRLAIALRAGAVYDWILALVILVAPPALFELARTPPPPDLFHFRLSAITLLLLGLVYWTVGADPAGRRWGVALSVAIRIVGGTTLAALTIAQRPAGMAIYLGFGLADLAWAALWLGLRRRA